MTALIYMEGRGYGEKVAYFHTIVLSACVYHRTFHLGHASFLHRRIDIDLDTGRGHGRPVTRPYDG